MFTDFFEPVIGDEMCWILVVIMEIFHLSFELVLIQNQNCLVSVSPTSFFFYGYVFSRNCDYLDLNFWGEDMLHLNGTGINTDVHRTL